MVFQNTRAWTLPNILMSLLWSSAVGQFGHYPTGVWKFVCILISGAIRIEQHTVNEVKLRVLNIKRRWLAKDRQWHVSMRIAMLSEKLP